MCAPGADPARGGAPGVPQAQLQRPPQAAAGGRSDQVTSQSEVLGYYILGYYILRYYILRHYILGYLELDSRDRDPARFIPGRVISFVIFMSLDLDPIYPRTRHSP